MGHSCAVRNALVADVAQYAIALVGLVALLAWLRFPARARTTSAAEVIGTLVLTFLLIKAGSAVYVDARPFVVDPVLHPLFPHAADNGFPSDHTAVCAAVGVVVLRYSRLAGALMLGLTLLIGWARVASHVHHWPDIAGGLVIGLVAAGVVLAASGWWQRRSAASGRARSARR